MQKIQVFPFLLLIITALSICSCAKRCPMDSCHMIGDHTHFFGGETDSEGAQIQKDAEGVNASLEVYSGVPWWRRIFKKKHRTEEGLRYKKFDKIRYSGKNKKELEKMSIK